jgi:hypothetical protein
MERLPYTERAAEYREQADKQREAILDDLA